MYTTNKSNGFALLSPEFLNFWPNFDVSGDHFSEHLLKYFKVLKQNFELKLGDTYYLYATWIVTIQRANRSWSEIVNVSEVNEFIIDVDIRFEVLKVKLFGTYTICANGAFGEW